MLGGGDYNQTALHQLAKKGHISTEGFVTGPAFFNVDMFEVL